MSEVLLLGNCLEVLKDFPDSSIDSIVCDPPYGLSFMGKKWDYDVPSVAIWQEVLRVLKPGGYLLSFGGTRTYHRMVVNIEDAGFEIRDQIQWLYGQGFPKSLDVKKSAIKSGLICDCNSNTKHDVQSLPETNLSETLDSTDESGQILQSSMQEQGTHKTMSRTESEKSLKNGEKSSLEGRDNLQTKQGELYRPQVRSMPTGLSSDGSKGRLHNGTSLDNGGKLGQVPNSDGSSSSQEPQYSGQSYSESRVVSEQSGSQTCRSCRKKIIPDGIGSALKPSNEPIVLARKPLTRGLTIAENILLHGTGGLNIDATRIGYANAKDAKDAGTHSGGGFTLATNFHDQNGLENDRDGKQGRFPANIILDEVVAEMLDEQSGILKSGAFKQTGLSANTEQPGGWQTGNRVEKDFGPANSGGASRFFYVAKASKRERGEGNVHPTVKPIKLMEYLIKLVTPPGGVVLDPFMGSGSTGVAAKNLGFDFIGIEMSEEYLNIATKRIS